MEHLHLFTPVEEGLPENSGWYITNITIDELQWYTKDVGFAHINFFGLAEPASGVTHWLDLSKLTTKKRAERAFNFIVGEEYMLNDVDLLEKCRTIL